MLYVLIELSLPFSSCRQSANHVAAKDGWSPRVVLSQRILSMDRVTSQCMGVISIIFQGGKKSKKKRSERRAENLYNKLKKNKNRPFKFR